MTNKKYTDEQANEIINTMIRQMNGAGAARLDAMLGLKSIYRSEVNGNVELTFAFKAKAKNKANHCRITYVESDDLYTMQLFSIGRAPKHKWTDIFELEGMYADMLKPVFEDETGLRLTLR